MWINLSVMPTKHSMLITPVTKRWSTLCVLVTPPITDKSNWRLHKAVKSLPNYYMISTTGDGMWNLKNNAVIIRFQQVLLWHISVKRQQLQWQLFYMYLIYVTFISYGIYRISLSCTGNDNDDRKLFWGFLHLCREVNMVCYWDCIMTPIAHLSDADSLFLIDYTWYVCNDGPFIMKDLVSTFSYHRISNHWC